jgi:hypothetical protein
VDPVAVPQEDGRPEDPLEGCGESAVLFAARRQAERVQHLGCASEADNLTLLLNSQGCQEDGYQSVLAIRQSKLRMSGQLKDEMAVPSLLKQRIGGRAAGR